MIYEFRIYEPHEGKSAALRQRFQAETLRIFPRHGISVIAVLRPEPDDGRLCYLTQFADEDTRLKAWSGFTSDADWLNVKAASERAGPLLKSQSLTVMTSVLELASHRPFAGSR